MATLTITIPDANVTRVRTAFGHLNGSSTWVPATTQEVQNALTAYLRREVRSYEEGLAQQAALLGVTDAV